MSSTNHTTNYNLPQFLGADKPAWLGDINPAFSAIDTQMKANDTKAQKGVDDAATAKGRADDAYTLADGAKTDAGTAQGTANTAIANASAVNTKVDGFIAKWNINNYTDSTLSGAAVANNELSLAQNSDGSIFKFYGLLALHGGQSLARTAIAGMSGWYGVDTGLQLNTAPSTAYIVKSAGVLSSFSSLTQPTYPVMPLNFAVGTDGRIYVFPNQSSGNYVVTNNAYERDFFMPCVYFNTSFGDDPTPEE